MEHTHNIEQRLSNIEALLIAQKKVLNFDEVAVYTGLSKSHLYKMTSTGGIPCYKPKGKHIYFERAEIDQWLLRGRKKTNEEIDGEASTIVTISSRRKKR
jgi:excisionase family DNA binding protein